MSHSLKSCLRAAVGVLAGTALSVSAANATIISAASAVINSGGPGFGSINDTFNQNGLSAGYMSGVTDFDAYIASGPTHTTIFSGFEWFSNEGTSSASVTYDLGGAVTIDRIALWNEESSGIGILDLFGSLDGMNFTALATGLSPTDHFLADYLADVFTFAAANVRYVRFDMSRCPQQNVGSFAACAIGEVAFGTAQDGVVPLPAAGWLMIAGLGAMGLARKSKRPQLAA